MKLKKGYKESNTNLKLQDLDFDNRVVKCYLASFNTIDSDADMFIKGAFAKSIQEHGPDSQSKRIKFLEQHIVTKMVGTYRILREDDKGLYAEIDCGTHTRGEDALRMYKDGLITEHSVGIEYIPDKTVFIESDKAMNEAMEFYGGYYQLKEVKLKEGSFVTWGANENTPNLSAIKSQDDLNSEIDRIDQRMQLFIKAIKDGNYSEVYNDLFEVELQQVQKAYKSLIHFEPANDFKIALKASKGVDYDYLKSNFKL